MSDEVIMCEELCDNESKYKQLGKASSLGLERKEALPWYIRSQFTAALYMERSLIHYMVFI